MRTGLRSVLVSAVVALLLAGGCSNDQSASTTNSAAGPSSSAPTTTMAVTTSAVTSPATTVPAAPVVTEASGWRLAITAPTVGTTIGPTFDLCYELTGPGGGDVAFDVNLTSTATGTPQTSDHVNATVGRGSARVAIGQPDIRGYNLTIQALLNGQPIPKLAVTIGVLFGPSTPPAGCP